MPNRWPLQPASTRRSPPGPQTGAVGRRPLAGARFRFRRLGAALLRSGAAVVIVAAVNLTQAQTPQQARLPPSPQALPRDQAQAALKRGDAQQALMITDEALNRSPNDARLRFTRAMALQQLNRLTEAEAAYASLTLEFPELPEPYNNLAVVRAAQGKLELARVALEEAIRAVPSYVPARENLADIHLQLAARNLAEASRLQPSNAALASRARALADAAAASAAAARGADSPPRP